MGRKLLTWAEEFESIGFKKGRAEGKAEGKLIALRAMVDTLLRSRFGELPAPALQRIEQGTHAQLDRWFKRGLTAASLDAVFGDGEQ